MEKLCPALIRIELRGVNAFLWTGQGGPTLIDTGYPWTYNKLLDELHAAGVQPSDLKRIIITHSDLDHIGGLKGLIEVSDAAIACHTVAADFITGKKKLPTPRTLDGRFAGLSFRAVESIYKPFIDESEIAELLLDKEKTPEGFTVVFLPGHCPGQIGLYHKKKSLFIAGDAIITKGGKLGMPPRVYTLNYKQAVESLQRLRKLRFDKACFGHGPCITQGADRKITDFLDALS